MVQGLTRLMCLQLFCYSGTHLSPPVQTGLTSWTFPFIQSCSEAEELPCLDPAGVMTKVPTVGVRAVCTEKEALRGWGRRPGQHWKSQSLRCRCAHVFQLQETSTCFKDPNLPVWNLNIGLSHYILISNQSLTVP